MNQNNNKLSKEEIIYNKILKIITILTIILIAIMIIVIIKKVFFDFGVEVFSKMMETNANNGRRDYGLFALPFIVGFKSYMTLPLVIIGVIIQVLLIVLLFKIRKTKERKIKWLELFYLLFLFVIALVVDITAELVDFNLVIFKLFLTILKCGRILNIILLIIILLKQRINYNKIKKDYDNS